MYKVVVKTEFGDVFPALEFGNREDAENVVVSLRALRDKCVITLLEEDKEILVESEEPADYIALFCAFCGRTTAFSYSYISSRFVDTAIAIAKNKADKQGCKFLALYEIGKPLYFDNNAYSYEDI